MIYGSQRNELQPKEKAKAMHSKIMVALLYFFFFFGIKDRVIVSKLQSDLST